MRSRTQIDWLPEPAAASRATSRSSRSTTTWSSRPTCSRGASPAKFADAAPRVMTEDDGAWSTGSTTASGTTRSGSTRWSASRCEQRTLRADALRRDAARRVRHPRARPRHGPQRRVRVAELPVVARRVRRPALPARRERPRARARRRARRERLAPRGVGRHVPRAASSRCSCRGCSTPRWARPRSARNAARGFHAVTFPELPERLGLPSLHTGYWDPFIAACAETETVVCLHVGLVVVGADHVVGRAVRHHRRAVLRLGDVRGGRLAVLQDPGALPRPEDLPVGGRHRLGGRACSTASTTSGATRRSTARGTASSSRRAR